MICKRIIINNYYKQYALSAFTYSYSHFTFLLKIEKTFIVFILPPFQNTHKKIKNKLIFAVSKQELTTLLNHVPKELFHSPHAHIRRFVRLDFFVIKLITNNPWIITGAIHLWNLWYLTLCLKLFMNDWFLIKHQIMKQNWLIPPSSSTSLESNHVEFVIHLLYLFVTECPLAMLGMRVRLPLINIQVTPCLHWPMLIILRYQAYLFLCPAHLFNP